MLDVYDIGWMDGWTAEHKSNKYAREWLCSLPSRSVVWCVALKLRAGEWRQWREGGQAENWTWSMCKNTTPAKAWDGTDFFFSHSTFSSTSPEMPVQRGPVFSYLFSRPRTVSSPGTSPKYMNGAHHFVATPASPFLPDLRACPQIRYFSFSPKKWKPGFDEEVAALFKNRFWLPLFVQQSSPFSPLHDRQNSALCYCQGTEILVQAMEIPTLSRLSRVQAVTNKKKVKTRI